MPPSTSPAQRPLQPYFENELAPQLSLDGEWSFRLGPNPERIIPVPAAWEAHITDKLTDGPAIYRRSFTRPDDWLGARILLEAQAISFDATIRINGQVAGHHRGMWSPFQIDVTSLVRPGENTIEVEVWKPGARFPIRESLAGFLPDVCTPFGGIWQSIRLRRFAQGAFYQVRIHAKASGQVEISGSLAESPDGLSPNQIQIEVLDNQHRSLTIQSAPIHGSVFSVACSISGVSSWPAAGYFLRLVLMQGEIIIAQLTRPIGLREVTALGNTTLMNGRAIQFRGVLDWGWNPDRLAPSFTRQELLDNFAKARALGFNLIKLCLFVPDEVFFDVADETGMLLWLEMPLWLARLSPEDVEGGMRASVTVLRVRSNIENAET